MKTFKEKIRKYSFWTGFSAAMVMLCNVIAKAFGFSIDSKIIEDIIMAICGVLVALGLVCAPKTQKTETVEQEEQQEKIKETKENKEDQTHINNQN